MLKVGKLKLKIYKVEKLEVKSLKYISWEAGKMKVEQLNSSKVDKANFEKFISGKLKEVKCYQVGNITWEAD